MFPQVPIFNFNTPAIEEMGYQGIQSGSLPVEPPYGPAEVNPTWGTTLVGEKIQSDFILI